MKHTCPHVPNQYSIWEFSPNGLSILKSKAWNAKHQGGEGYAKSRQVAVVELPINSGLVKVYQGAWVKILEPQAMTMGFYKSMIWRL